MQKSTTPNNQFLFVCYQPGAGGEKLSTWISQLPPCQQLDFYKTPQDRTVITNEYFEKTFLTPVGPFENLLDKAKLILGQKLVPEKINVVPSHWDYDLLHPHFEYSKFIRIVHNNTKDINQVCSQKVLDGKLTSLLELKGYCLMYVTEEKFLELLLQRRISLSMTIGDIYNTILPHKSKSVEIDIRFENYTKTVDQCNVLNIWYGNFDQQKIIDFVNF